MNLGPFCKDIWEIIFFYFEINFCPDTLNALSLTCKKLNNIDNERRSRYINTAMQKSSFVHIKEYEKTLLFRKSRMDYVSFNINIKILI